MPDEVVPTAAAAAPENRPTPSGATPARPASTPSRAVAPAGRPSTTGGMRARLARLGGQRSSVLNPVLEPLFRSIRANDPKADPALLRDIEKAYAVAEKWHRGQKRKSGDPYITHPLAVATILAELGMDAPTLMAGLLHDTVEDTDYGLETLRKDFGDSVALLVDGVTKLDRVKFGEAAQAETVRKMVVAMAKDPRVLVIKLADRLHNMRTMRYLKREKQEKKARETLEIYAPLAHRLGMNTIKWELEDLAFAILYPKMYDEIVRLVAERAPKRDEYLATVIDQVQGDLRGARITASVTGRPKHYYSVYQKMIVRGRDFAEIYDLVGIRVLVDTVRDCYAALGTIHARWNPVPGRFKDYIAMPKFNMYQSLHTTVIGPGASPSSCRSAPSTCTAGPSTGSRRTGSTSSARWPAPPRCAPTPRPRPARTTRPAPSTRWPGCGSCWTGRRRPPTRASSWSRSASTWPATRSSSSRPRATS